MSEKVKNKLVFVTKDSEGKSFELSVKRPNVEQTKELQKVWNKAFNEALASGAILRVKINDFARRQGVWDDVKEKELAKLQKELHGIELKIKMGGKANLSKNKAKELAFRVHEIREAMRELTAGRNDLDGKSAEAQAENERFSYAVYLCTAYPDSGDPYFKDYEDFKARETQAASIDAAKYLAFLTYNLDPNYEGELFENKFLKDYGFVDEKLRLINKEGKLVDREGRLIREDGRFINPKGELIDADGNPVDEEGNYKVEFAPFLEDEEDAVEDKKTVKK